jgi:hypothetical protein
MSFRSEAMEALKGDVGEIYQSPDGAMWWYDHADKFACEKVIARRGDVSGKVFLRVKPKGQPVLNHWDTLTTFKGITSYWEV